MVEQNEAKVEVVFDTTQGVKVPVSVQPFLAMMQSNLSSAVTGWHNGDWKLEIYAGDFDTMRLECRVADILDLIKTEGGIEPWVYEGLIEKLEQALKRLQMAV